MSINNVNKSLDVHGLHLNEAIKIIERNVEISYENGISVLYINHGFNNGSKIKTWCLNKGNQIKHVIKVMPGINEGITNFYIEAKLF